MNIKTLNKLEKFYNPRLAVSDYKNHLEKSFVKAKNSQKKLNGLINIRYGKGPLQFLDIFGADKKTLKPIHIFIHGGYWRGLDKNYHSHMAVPFNDNDIIFINLNYDLCPKIKLSRIKLQIIEALKWVLANAINFGGNKNNIVISGHSAGAHIVSQILGMRGENYGLKENTIKGAALISGIYEPEIVVNMEINKEIGLTLREAKKNNTISSVPLYKIPIIIAAGSLEPLLWQKQSMRYFNMLKKEKFNTEYFLVKNNHHFSLIDTLANRKFNLVKAIINLSH